MEAYDAASAQEDFSLVIDTTADLSTTVYIERELENKNSMIQFKVEFSFINTSKTNMVQITITDLTNNIATNGERGFEETIISKNNYGSYSMTTLTNSSTEWHSVSKSKKECEDKELCRTVFNMWTFVYTVITSLNKNNIDLTDTKNKLLYILDLQARELKAIKESGTLVKP